MRQQRLTQEELDYVSQEVHALQRAVADTKSRKPKTQSQHKEDESWLDWAIKAGKKYGPQLLEALELGL